MRVYTYYIYYSILYYILYIYTYYIYYIYTIYIYCPSKLGYATAERTIQNLMYNFMIWQPTFYNKSIDIYFLYHQIFASQIQTETYTFITSISFQQHQPGLASALGFSKFKFLNVFINLGTGFITDDDLVDVHEVLEAGFPCMSNLYHWDVACCRLYLHCNEFSWLLPWRPDFL